MTDIQSIILIGIIVITAIGFVAGFWHEIIENYAENKFLSVFYSIIASIATWPIVFGISFYTLSDYWAYIIIAITFILTIIFFVILHKYYKRREYYHRKRFQIFNLLMIWLIVTSVSVAGFFQNNKKNGKKQYIKEFSKLLSKRIDIETPDTVFVGEDKLLKIKLLKRTFNNQDKYSKTFLKKLQNQYLAEIEKTKKILTTQDSLIILDFYKQKVKEIEFYEYSNINVGEIQTRQTLKNAIDILEKYHKSMSDEYIITQKLQNDFELYTRLIDKNNISSTSFLNSEIQFSSTKYQMFGFSSDINDINILIEESSQLQIQKLANSEQAISNNFFSTWAWKIKPKHEGNISIFITIKGIVKQKFQIDTVLIDVIQKNIYAKNKGFITKNNTDRNIEEHDKKKEISLDIKQIILYIVLSSLVIALIYFLFVKKKIYRKKKAKKADNKTFDNAKTEISETITLNIEQKEIVEIKRLADNKMVGLAIEKLSLLLDKENPKDIELINLLSRMYDEACSRYRGNNSLRNKTKANEDDEMKAVKNKLLNVINDISNKEPEIKENKNYSIMNTNLPIRQKQLNQKIESQYKLLGEWEEKRDLSQNPTEKMSCETEIEKIKKVITDYEIELNKIAGNSPMINECKHLILENSFGRCMVKSAPTKYVIIEKSIKEKFTELWSLRHNSKPNSVPPDNPKGCSFFNYPLTECTECPQYNKDL